MSNLVIPRDLQAQVRKEVLDEQVTLAKGRLLNNIKRSAHVYRVDCGGCNACEIEIFASITPVFDAERFGIKVVASPRHADILVYTGAVTRSMRMPAFRAFEGTPDPKIVVSYGACGCSGGIFHDNYCVWGGTDKLLPVDVYIPGCPPSPAQTIYGFAIALGLLDQKLKHKESYQSQGEHAPLIHPEIPLELRVDLECIGRLMSGYLYGKKLADNFIEVIKTNPQNTMQKLNAFVDGEKDPRRREVYTEMRNLITSMAVEV